jgi:site-specific recombinase XerD
MEQAHLEEFREYLASTKGLAKLTQSYYCNYLRDFDLHKLSQSYIDDYIQKKGNNTQLRGALLSLFQMIGMSKSFDIPPAKSGTKKVRVVRKVGKEEFERVRKHLYSQSFRKGLIFDLIYQGALRRAEVPTIRINSFLWEEFLKDITKPCKLKIKGKGDKDRIVLVNPSTAEKIFNKFAERYDFEEFKNSPTFLFSKNKRPISTKDIWKIIHNGSKEAIGRDIRPHELRSSRATELINMGVQIHDVKNYLGHSSIGTTEIYLQTSKEESIANIQDMIREKE